MYGRDYPRASAARSAVDAILGPGARPWSRGRGADSPSWGPGQRPAWFRLRRVGKSKRLLRDADLRAQLIAGWRIDVDNRREGPGADLGPLSFCHAAAADP